MNNLDNVRRFVDTFPLSITDDAEFESKHKRDKNGQFAKTAESGGNNSESEDKNDQHSFEELTNRVKIGEKVLDALPDITDKATIDAINVYTQDTTENAPFKKINRSLRKTGEFPEEFKKECLAIEKAFETSKTSEPIFLARGTTVGYVESWIKDSVYSEPNFLSTSITLNSPFSFAFDSAKKYKDKPAIVYLFVPSGAKALKIDKLGANPKEREILLPRNTKCVLRDKIEDNGVVYYHVEVTK